MLEELPKKPKFEPIKPQDVSNCAEIQYRFVGVPQHRRTPLFKAWKTHFYDPITNDMSIDIRMNLKAKRVELKTMPHTPDISNLQKCADYVEAFMSGFDPDQIRDVFFKWDHFFLSSIDMKDVKRTLMGKNHLSRAIGRICGKGGKTKFMIENATRTRIVVSGDKIYIVGSYDAIRIAKDCLYKLILGSSTETICSRLRTITVRASERF